MGKPSSKINIKPTTAPKPPPRTGPLVVAAEFGPAPLELVTGDSRTAPKVAGYACVAAWDVRTSFDDQFAFELLAEKMGNVHTMYHGTGSRSVANIAKEGLRPGSASCMFGAGIYVGPMSKAFNYARGMQARYIFEVRVILGKVLRAEAAKSYSAKTLKSLGFDSVKGEAFFTKSWFSSVLQNTEYVLYDRAQVMVTRVFEYQSRQVEAPTVYTSPCQVLRDKNIPLETGNSAFKDILTKKPCGKPTATSLPSTGGTVWVCAVCVDQLNLKIGSKIDVKLKTGAPAQTVKLKRSHD